MESDLLASLSRPQREAVESAGYRVLRWAAAREVLQARVAKGRLYAGLGDFLAHWLPPVIPSVDADDLQLEFNIAPGQMHLTGGGGTLVASSLEHAILHLPALRSFWSQEMRLQHFLALRALVPKAWVLDDAMVPPGAVIHDLDLVSWEQLPLGRRTGWEIRDQTGRTAADWRQALTSRHSVLAFAKPDGTKLNARYARNDKGQVVLRSVEASP